MKMNKIAAALCATVAFSAPAFAGVVSFDFTSINSGSTDLFKQLSVQKFDSSLGTLTGIQLVYSSDVTSSVNLTNDGKKATVADVRVDATLSLYRPDNTLVAPAVSATLYNTSVSLAKGQTIVDAATGSKTLTLNALLDSSSDFALFTGTGVISSPFSVVATSHSSSSTGLSADFTTTANGYGKVTYTFTAAPVPEPETYAMLLAGLALVGVVARRRKSA